MKHFYLTEFWQGPAPRTLIDSCISDENPAPSLREKAATLKPLRNGKELLIITTFCPCKNSVSLPTAATSKPSTPANS
jgi:hypothetical protein